MIAARNIGRTARLLLLVALTAGCAASPQQIELNPAEWERTAQRLGLEPEQLVDPLTFDAEMERAARDWAGRGTPRQQLSRLQEALFDVTGPGFAYESARSLTATEAFEARSGNCLSFTNLFISMGRALGFRLQGALPQFVPRSDREGDLIVVNDHVVAAFLHADGVTLYDFDRSRSGPPIAFELIDDLQMTALFLNNRGVEQLQSNELTRAAITLDAATRLWPEFEGAWGNLAVTRRRKGDTAGALEAYRQALESDASNPTVLANLAALYRTLDKTVEARAALDASRVRHAAPDVLIVQGDLQLQIGDVDTALALYRRAHHLEPTRVDPLLRIARAELDRGRRHRANRALRRARELEPDDTEVDRLWREMLHDPVTP